MTVSENDLKDPMYWIRWSVNSGLMTGTAQTLLYSCAALAYPGIAAVEMSVDVQLKTIDYTISLESKTYNLFNKFIKLSSSNDIISLWRLRRLVRKHGNTNIPEIVSKEVERILGASWRTNVSIVNADELANSGRDG